MNEKEDSDLLYSARLRTRRIDADAARQRLHHLFLSCREKGFFQEISHDKREVERILRDDAMALIGVSAFPLYPWLEIDPVSEENIFDIVELLFQRVSKPDYGFNEVTYSSEEAQTRFRKDVNNILRLLGEGYELTSIGQVERIGTKGLDFILNAEIPTFDPTNVDNKVREAVSRWKQRQSNRQDRHEAVRLLADVFEWLQKKGQLSAALDSADESALFQIANTFAIRHHNPKQKSNYDPDIWHRWMFHFYLATYHASVRLILKKRRGCTPWANKAANP